MDGPTSGSRSLAQAEVLRALAQVFPDPLIELAQVARTSLTAYTTLDESYRGQGGVFTLAGQNHESPPDLDRPFGGIGTGLLRS